MKDTGEVQLYRVENEEGTLLISKVYENGSKELAGARLALYRADEEGGLTRSSRYLFDSWVSGSDGHYTELDAINRRIPQGYAEGDLKPHRDPASAGWNLLAGRAGKSGLLHNV